MALKSAWELALQRTGGQSSVKLTDAQKARLAELDKLYTAKIAQEELTLKPRIASAPDAETAEKLEEQLKTAIARLRRKLEEQKEAIRQSP
jgi:hypothetical protein